MITSIDNDIMGLTKFYQLLIVVEYGIGSFYLLFGIDFWIIGIYHNPGGASGKASVWSVVPLHRSTGIIAAFVAKVAHHVFRSDLTAFCVFMVGIDAFDIPEVIKTLEGNVSHA